MSAGRTARQSVIKQPVLLNIVAYRVRSLSSLTAWRCCLHPSLAEVKLAATVDHSHPHQQHGQPHRIYDGAREEFLQASPSFEVDESTRHTASSKPHSRDTWRGLAWVAPRALRANQINAMLARRNEMRPEPMEGGATAAPQLDSACCRALAAR